LPPGNIISKNIGIGLYLTNCDRNYIKGNLIGLDVEGDTAGNSTGIFINNSHGNIIGSTDFSVKNVISGNRNHGIVLSGILTINNLISGNYIGTDIIGIGNKGNNDNGIVIRNQAKGNRIGLVWSPNLIAFNKNNGIEIDNTLSNEINSNKIISNNIGISLGISTGDKILNNKIINNNSGIIVTSNRANTTIMGNEVIQNKGSNTGIHLNNSFAKIYGNTITDDAGDGITLENGSDALINKNNIYNNQGYGLNNTDVSVTIDAQDNWWGSETGPSGEGTGSGDEVSAGVNFDNWRSEIVSLILSVGVDTVFIPAGDRDSIVAFVRNWLHPTEVVDIEVVDENNWLMEPTTSSINLNEEYGGGTIIKFEVPIGLDAGTGNNVVIEATSQTEPSTVELDSFLIFIYTPDLTQIYISPDSISLAVGDSLQFDAYGIDQHNQRVSFIPVWVATGGTVSESGFYVAGDSVGEFTVTTADESGRLQSSAYVKIQENVVVEIDDEETEEQLPEEYRLYQSYPNPFNPVTTIAYDLPDNCDVRLDIYNITGRRIETLVNQRQPAGYYSIHWNASNNASGIYFYRISTKDFQQVKKCLLLK